jgi:hypothetical protein
MRRRLLPVSLLLSVAALAQTRNAAADDGAMIVRKPVAPIAGAPYWYENELEAPPRKAKSPALVIVGAIVGSLGAAGAVTGAILQSTAQGVEGDQRQSIGMTTMFIGAGVAAAGLTALLVGIQPRAEDEAKGAPEDGAATRRWLTPTVAVGPTGGSITFRF